MSTRTFLSNTPLDLTKGPKVMVSDEAMKAKALSRGSLAQQVNPGPRYDLTADEQIRMKVLECAVRFMAAGDVWRAGDLDAAIQKFEDYLRNGRDGN